MGPIISTESEESMGNELPPGPRMAPLLQTLGVWSRPTAFLERARARYGTPFAVRMAGFPTQVMISDPDQIKQIFTAPPEVLHPGEGATILEPVVGRHSVILLDEQPHLEQRKLMLPSFHGERMQRLAGLMTEIADRELDGWPLGEPTQLHPRLQQLTLEIILGAVFGLRRGERMERLRDRLTALLAFAESPLSVAPAPVQRVMRRLRRENLLEEVDTMIFDLVEERRAASADDSDDVLSMLLQARHEDGSPMSRQELRDELITSLVAGHETTASQLAWTFCELARAPQVLARLREEVLAGEGEDYLTATIHEVMRRRPVLPNAEPRLVRQPVEIGGRTYQPGVVLLASAYLLHHDPAIYPEPYAFRPERFLGEAPGTYTWIPFGGGRRRCLGASFATVEMRIVLRSALTRFDLRASGPLGTRRRSITLSPADGALLTLQRVRAAAPAQAQAEAPVEVAA